MKDVMITVKGIQAQPDGTDEDCIELLTEGKYFYDGENGAITYLESELTGFEGCITTFTISPEYVVMNRVGSGSGDMVFDTGKRHQYYYETPAGNVTLGIDTLSIKNELGEDGGDLEIHYLLDLDTKVFSQLVCYKYKVRDER